MCGPHPWPSMLPCPMQVPERFDYLAGDHPLTAFRFIRTCLLRGHSIFLRLVHWAQLAIPEGEMGQSGVDMNCARITAAPIAVDLLNETVETAPWETFLFSLWDITAPIVLDVEEIAGLQTTKSVNFISVSICLFNGHSATTSPVTTEPMAANNQCWLGTKCQLGIFANDLPLESKLLVRIRGHRKRNREPEQELGWGFLRLFDHHGLLRQGRQVLTLSQGAMDPFCPSSLVKGPVISLALPTFAFPVEHPLFTNSATLVGKLAAKGHEEQTREQTRTMTSSHPETPDHGRPRSASIPGQVSYSV